MRFLTLIFLFSLPLGAQELFISGVIVDSLEQVPIEHARIECIQHGRTVISGPGGSFSIYLQDHGCSMRFSNPGYRERRVLVQGEQLGLRVALLPLELPVINWEEELIEGGEQVFLGSGWDLFQRRIAFDLGQAFYRPRGLDSREQSVYLNGFRMNYHTNGRVNWSDWGGLNDVLRSREIHYGMDGEASADSGPLGSVHMSTDPTSQRPGLRFSSSYSDRAYRGRVMLTYTNSGSDRLISYSLSASARRGARGFMDATPYHAYSAFGGLRFRISPAVSLAVYGFHTDTRKGRSAALTRETRDLLGPRYNPYWGMDRGEIRNAKTRDRQSSLFQFLYTFHQGDLDLTLGAAWQESRWQDGRLGYFNAPNPDPTYYRYLPSYYSSNPSFPNPFNAHESKVAILRRPQLDWAAIRRANRAPIRQGKAAYALLEDVLERSRYWAIGRLGFQRSGFRAHAGFAMEWCNAHEYGLLTDLLGAQYFDDRDPFNGMSFDVSGPGNKKVGDLVNHNLNLSMVNWRANLDFVYGWRKWTIDAKMHIQLRKDSRKGVFQNAVFKDNSNGSSDPEIWRAGLYRLNLSFTPDQRHQLALGLLQGHRPPVLDAVWLERRQSSIVLPFTAADRVSGTELSYRILMKGFSGTARVYHVQSESTPPVRAFYAESGFGDGFYRLSRAAAKQGHYGLELSGEYEWMLGLKVNAVMSHGVYRYQDNPSTLLYPDGASEPLPGGLAQLAGEPLGGGPTTALSIGLEYRDPDHWFLGITLNQLEGARLQPAILRRTETFLQTSPGGGIDLPSRSLPPVLLTNLVGGKSWMRGRAYISFFASVSNLFGQAYLSGGYEQERKATYESWIRDQASGQPLFGPKYWSGYGRTLFLNLAISLR